MNTPLGKNLQNIDKRKSWTVWCLLVLLKWRFLVQCLRKKRSFKARKCVWFCWCYLSLQPLHPPHFSCHKLNYSPEFCTIIIRSSTFKTSLFTALISAAKVTGVNPSTHCGPFDRERERKKKSEGRQVNMGKMDSQCLYFMLKIGS